MVEEKEMKRLCRMDIHGMEQYCRDSTIGPFGVR